MNLQDLRSTLERLRDNRIDIEDVTKDFPIHEIEKEMMSREMPELNDYQEATLNKLKNANFSVFLWSMFGQIGLVDTPYCHKDDSWCQEYKYIYFADEKQSSVEDEVFSQEYHINAWLDKIKNQIAYQTHNTEFESCIRTLFTMPLFWGMNIALFGKNNSFVQLFQDPETPLMSADAEAYMTFKAIDDNGRIIKTPIKNKYGYTDICIGDFQGTNFAQEALRDFSQAIVLSRNEHEASQMLRAYLMFRYLIRHGRSFASRYFMQWGLFNQISENMGLQLEINMDNLKRFIQELNEILE